MSLDLCAWTKRDVLGYSFGEAVVEIRMRYKLVPCLAPYTGNLSMFIS